MKKYCAAPWATGLLHANGKVSPCCYAPVSFGDWLEEDLYDVWNSNVAVRIRESILDGKFINNTCKMCYEENRSHSLTKLLNLPFNTNARIIGAQWPRLGVPLKNLKAVFLEMELTEEVESQLKELRAELETVFNDDVCTNITRKAIQKIRVVIQIAEDFLTGNLNPLSVAPHRSTTIIGVCNSRCVQCPMKFSGEIEKGILTKGKKYIKYVEKEDIERALSYGTDVVSFHPLASELLLYPYWKFFAQRLSELGIKLRLATNGMALHKEHAEFIVDNALLSLLTFSLDGASKEIYENVRVNLIFEKVVQNIKYFFSYAAKHNYNIHVGFSFCLMNRNFTDLSRFVDLVNSFKEAGDNKISVGIGVHSLQQVGPKEYLEFMRQEHHSTIAPRLLGEEIIKMQEKSVNTGIQVTVFNKYPIKEFVAKYSDRLLAGEKVFDVGSGVNIEECQ